MFRSFFTLSRAGSMISRKPMTQEASSTTSIRCQDGQYHNNQLCLSQWRFTNYS
jgi:hypothetical protein